MQGGNEGKIIKSLGESSVTGLSPKTKVKMELVCLKDQMLSVTDLPWIDS